MIEQIFPTKEEQEEAKSALKTLVNSKGWKIIEKLLDFDIEKIDNELKTQDFQNIIELKAKQDQYATRVIMKDLPKDVIRALSDEPTEKVELDPYWIPPSKEEAN